MTRPIVDSGTLGIIGESSTQTPSYTITLPGDFDPANSAPRECSITVVVTGTGTPPHPSISDTQTVNWTEMVGRAGLMWHRLVHGGNSTTGLYTLYWRAEDPENLALDVSYPSDADGSQKWGQTFAISDIGGGRPPLEAEA